MNKLDTGHSEELFKTHIGGAAMLEGVMMRGKYNWAVAVREPHGGIYLEEHDVPGYGKQQFWRKWPLVRGCVSLIESLALQLRAMGITSAHSFELQPASKDGDMNGSTSALYPELEVDQAPDYESDGLAGWMIVSMIIGALLSVMLFVVAPAALTNLVIGQYSRDNMFAWNLFEGFLRVGIFVLYIWLIRYMPDIKRMFGYHGAEHQTIHCLEHGLPLTPENCSVFQRQHVRCGTAFIIMTLIVSIIVFSVFPTDLFADFVAPSGGFARFGAVVLSRLLLFPVVAGVSYEITVRWAGNHPEKPLVKVVLAPGMAMQLLTTDIPDASMLECAIAAMKAVVAREAFEEGFELDENGLPVDLKRLEGCALSTAVPEAIRERPRR